MRRDFTQCRIECPLVWCGIEEGRGCSTGLLFFACCAVLPFMIFSERGAFVARIYSFVCGSRAPLHFY